MYGWREDRSFPLSLLVRDRARSEELQEALGDIQRVENALPNEHHREGAGATFRSAFTTSSRISRPGAWDEHSDDPAKRSLLARQYGAHDGFMRGNILLNDDFPGRRIARLRRR